MSAKQKIVYGRGPSNINLGIFVCSFDAAGLHNHNNNNSLILVVIIPLYKLFDNYYAMA